MVLLLVLEVSFDEEVELEHPTNNIDKSIIYFFINDSSFIKLYNKVNKKDAKIKK